MKGEMNMLKVKENANLEVLEKYGFVKEDAVTGGTWYIKSFESECYVEYLTILCESRKVHTSVLSSKYGSEPNVYSVESLDAIYDLMADGIIVKE
jgi:hypothetical protein